MKCSDELWQKSTLNPNVDPSLHPKKRTWKDLLLKISPPEPRHSSGLTQRERFNSWKFLYDICHYGPPYFSQFQEDLENFKPEEIDAIRPIVKTPIYPARAMEYSNSTVSGNISTIENLMEQGGVGDPNDVEMQYVVEDMTLHIVLFHGDLGTGDRIFSVQLRRSIEKTPWKRFQYVAFVPGLFHVKMACADAIWRLTIKPPSARIDETSLMHDISKLRPGETGIMGSNPGFRRMHQTINHSGICRRLDSWCVLSSQLDKKHTTLELFAESKPNFTTLQTMANTLSHQYVANHNMDRLRRQPANQRDEQHENSLLINKYFLLYEELSYGMNSGDIGRIERCLLPWIFIFRGTGKHKYAMHLTRFLSDVHFLYNERLKKAVRWNWLVNPTGKADRFRGVDWCVELQNLWTKVEHGGSGSTRTIERIIKESPLVQTYQNIRATIEKNFSLPHLSSAHSDPNMRKTFQQALLHLSQYNPHKIKPNRKSAHVIPDAIDQGRKALPSGGAGSVEMALVDEIADEDEDAPAEVDDVLVELT